MSWVLHLLFYLLILYFLLYFLCIYLLLYLLLHLLLCFIFYFLLYLLFYFLLYISPLGQGECWHVLRIASACSAGAARLSIGETHFAVLTCFDYLGFSFQALYVDVSLPALKSHVSTILDIVFRHYMLTCKLSGVRTLAEIMTFLQFAKMYNIVSQMKN